MGKQKKNCAKEKVEYSDDLFKDVITATIGDIYYAQGVSLIRRIHSIRYLTECYVRKLIKYGPGTDVKLGDNEIKKQLRNVGVNEEFFWEAYNIIRTNGNNRSHPSDVTMPTDEEFENVSKAVVTIQAYLFFDFFKKYPFGTNDKIESHFSLLPPFFRLTVLRELVLINLDNAEIIYKYGLIAVRTLGKENALKEINQHKKKFSTHSMPIDSNYAKQVLEQCGIYVYAQMLQSMSKSVYAYLVDFINQTGDAFDRLVPRYSTFEEAKNFFLSQGKVDDNTPDAIEFNSLMDYIYIGRKSFPEES